MKKAKHKSDYLDLTRVLQRQITEISAMTDLQGWWNWHPDRKFGAGAGSCEIEETLAPSYCKLGPTEVVVEVVVADLHDRVIAGCHSCFQSLNLPVKLQQTPIQEAILDSLQGSPPDVVETWVIFGGYGNGKIHSHLQKQLYEAFPDQMTDLHEQAMSDAGGDGLDEHDVNMANQGCVWSACPAIASPSGPISFISCAAYPRCQYPSEREHVRSMFRRSLNLVATKSAYLRCRHYSRMEIPYACLTAPAQHKPPNHRKQRIKIITHALGSFVGHTNPEIFGWGLANGLRDFVMEQQD